MSLASSSDTCATAICTALGVVDTPSINNWKAIMAQIASWISTNGNATIALNSITTVGSAATQQGPTAPVQAPIS